MLKLVGSLLAQLKIRPMFWDRILEAQLKDVEVEKVKSKSIKWIEFLREKLFEIFILMVDSYYFA